MFIVTPTLYRNLKMESNTPTYERICVFCQSLEDEYHCIIECNSYIELRKQHFPIYYWKHTNMLKFTELINCTNAHSLRNVGSYVNKALSNELLYRNMSHQFKYVRLVFSKSELYLEMVSFIHVVYLTLFYVNIYCIAMYTDANFVCYVYASWVYDLLVIIE